jgi:UPF0716 protein FxsA
MILLLLFVVLPVAEIALLVFVSDVIGAWRVVGLIVLTAIIGSLSIRKQGLETIKKINRSHIDAIPAAMADGIILLVAGILLLTPGIITDLFGFFLLVPAFRYFVLQRIQTRLMRAQASQSTDSTRSTDDTEPLYAEPSSLKQQRSPSRPNRNAEDAQILSDRPGNASE